MTLTAMLIAALILLSAVGLVIWTRLAMAQVEEDLLSLGGFERTHFEVGPQQRKSPRE